MVKIVPRWKYQSPPGLPYTPMLCSDTWITVICRPRGKSLREISYTFPINLRNHEKSREIREITWSHRNHLKSSEITWNHRNHGNHRNHWSHQKSQKPQMRNPARYFWKWFTPRCRLFQENQAYKKHRGSKPKIKNLFIIMIRFDFQRPKEENIIAIFKVESSLKWSRYTIDYLINGDGGPFLNRNCPPPP